MQAANRKCCYLSAVGNFIGSDHAGGMKIAYRKCCCLFATGIFIGGNYAGGLKLANTNCYCLCAVGGFISRDHAGGMKLDQQRMLLPLCSWHFHQWRLRWSTIWRTAGGAPSIFIMVSSTSGLPPPQMTQPPSPCATMSPSPHRCPPDCDCCIPRRWPHSAQSRLDARQLCLDATVSPAIPRAIDDGQLSQASPSLCHHAAGHG